MNETSYIPGYRDINVQAFYRPQEDYAFANNIRAKQFIYNPYFKKELKGPYIKKMYEPFEMNKPHIKTIFSPHILSHTKLNRQCNPLVSYPYGIPRDIEYEKCPKCKGKKKEHTIKYNKKEKKNINKIDTFSYEDNFFVSRLKPEYNNSTEEPHINIEKNNDNDNVINMDIYDIENIKDKSKRESYEDTYSIPMGNENIHDYSHSSTNSYDVIKELNKPRYENLDNFPMQYINTHDNDDSSMYYYSYNEKENFNSQEKIKKKNLDLKDLHINDEINIPNKYKNDQKYKHNEVEESSSSLNSDEKYEIDNIISKYNNNNDIQKDNKKKMNLIDNNIINTDKKGKKDLLIMLINDLTHGKIKHKKEKNDEKYQMNHENKIKRENMIKNENVVKNEEILKNTQQNLKQVKICENENIFSKYNVMEIYKNQNSISTDNIKEKNTSKQNAHHMKEHEKKKEMEVEHYHRYCKSGNGKNGKNEKNEKEKKHEDTKIKRVYYKNSFELPKSNEQDMYQSNLSKKKSFNPKKNKKVSIEKEPIVFKKSKDDQSKIAKQIIARAKSMKMKRIGTINFPTKNSNNISLKKRNTLKKLNTMVESKFKKQNTIVLKKRKTMPRLHLTKPPNPIIFINKKKFLKAQKTVHIHDNNKKNKNNNTNNNNNNNNNNKKILSRSKTKVYINNKSKIFKKAEVKMVSKNPFNILASNNSSKTNIQDEKDKNTIKKDYVVNNNKNLNIPSKKDKPQINNHSVRNKLKSKKDELYQNILSLTKNMKEQPLKKTYHEHINHKDLLSLTSKNSDEIYDNSVDGVL
ncbi:hypothetical protein PFHG_03916 [Plasmodium falciparum HB3]|uniref:Uncharacterized protein n=2 Tax=Plasmodium falciparum TaxID=5833 RepID=A0A024WT15_PLAFA|nr:hypothetical protein PFMALIP_02198 [Plasmodium falciparum MaliPS096_E11]KOB62174.1 hypothetical protein PFHG_03916 [Plasmodium falciparum HB3]